MSGVATVLICAAEGQGLRALRVILREHGYESLVAADATTAIGRSAASHPTAAIVDLRGGGEDGVELTSRLRVADRLLPILVVGGEDDVERGIEALRAAPIICR